MMGERPAQDSADFVIWGSTAALSLISGIGAAFALWNMLHRSNAPDVASAAVAALGVGLGLIGFAVPKPVARLFLLGLAVTTLAAYFLGAEAFAALAGP